MSGHLERILEKKTRQQDGGKEAVSLASGSMIKSREIDGRRLDLSRCLAVVQH